MYNHKGFTLIELLIVIVIVTIIGIGVTCGILAITGISKGINYIDKHGTKSVIERVWNGPDSTKAK